MKIIIEPENGPVQVWNTEPAENRATLYENRAKDLETRLAKEKDRAEAWELRCGELEQELRDAQERIHEQDWVIAKYDDENRELKDAMDSTDTEISMFREELAKAEAELDECRRDKNRLMDECTKLRGKNPVSLNEWASVIHENAVAHGWWAQGVCDGGDFRIDGDVDRPLPEILMLCVCELAESMEEYRNGKPLIYEGDNGKPEGIAVEMVDCIIRILDWMAHNGVDVDELIQKKHEYNRTRPYRHGGKKA